MPDDLDNPQTYSGKSLLQKLDSIIGQIDEVYKKYNVTTFSVIYRKLKDISIKYSVEFAAEEFTEIEMNAGPVSLTKGQSDLNIRKPAAGEKYIYVRLYHRYMEKFKDSVWQDNWTRPLIESVKNSERHGLAIYEHESDAMRSIRGPQYAYMTAIIKLEQDVTAARAARKDPELGVPLLVVQNINEEEIIAFSYNGETFSIRNGRIVIKHF
jgi:hypothetical protein